MSPISPIIVIDSGLGGLTVVRALRQTLPAEDIVYFGDTARLPYGSKTAMTVTAFVHQIITYLRSHNPKHVVIACNTATALALPAMRVAFPDMQRPASSSRAPRPQSSPPGRFKLRSSESWPPRRRSLCCVTRESRPIGVEATRAFCCGLLRCLVPDHIEEGAALSSDPLVRLAALRQYIEPMVKHHMDVMVLGCTHYPVYRALIQKLAGSAMPVIDSARQCAEDVARRLRTAGMARAGKIANPGEAAGYLRCFVTDDPPRFQRLAPRFLGVEIEKPEWVAPEDLYSQPGPTRLSIPA